MAPPPGPALSWVLAVGQDERLQLTAFDDPQIAAKFLSNTARTRFYALGYNSELPSLGLTAGPIEPAIACERRCELTRPSYHLVLEWDPVQDPVWTEASTPDPAVLDALVPDRHERCLEGCITFTETNANLPSSAETSYLLAEALDPQDPSIATSALLGLKDGSLFRVGDKGEVERLCQPTGALPSCAAYEPGRRELWVARADSTLGWIDLEALDRERPCPFTRTTTLPTGALVIRLALARGATPPELLTLSSTGAIARLTGSARRSIGSVALREGDMGTPYGFALAVPGGAYFGAGGDQIAILQGNQLSVRSKLAQGLTCVVSSCRGNADSAIIYGGDVYFGVDTFNLYVSRGGTAAIDALSEGAGRVQAPWEDPKTLTVLQGHIFAGLSRGLLGEWSERTDYCQPRKIATSGVLWLLNIRGNLFVGDGDQTTLPDRAVRWLEPDRKEVCAK